MSLGSDHDLTGWHTLLESKGYSKVIWRGKTASGEVKLDQTGDCEKKCPEFLCTNYFN